MSTRRTVAVSVMKRTGAIDMLIEFAPVSSKLFTHNHERCELCTEISDLGRTFNFRQLWDDACDVGIRLLNPATNQVTTWSAQEVYDADGELTHWVLNPIRETVASFPQTRNYKILIYND